MMVEQLLDREIHQMRPKGGFDWLKRRKNGSLLKTGREKTNEMEDDEYCQILFLLKTVMQH